MLVNEKVRQSGKSNAEGLQIPISTNLNVQFFEQMCKDSKHNGNIRYLKYGWPLGHDGKTIPDEPRRNHKGVREFQEETKQYIQTERQKGRIYGPCNKKVFSGKNGISPLNSVPRKNDSRRRFILDLSFPKGKGINAGIDKNRYQGEEVTLKYPTVDDLVNLIWKRKTENPGQKVLLWKRDLKSCYRQFHLCPGSVHLVGYKWDDKYYYDLVLAMGSSSSAQICQKITDMVSYIFQNRFEDEVKNFLDDFFSAQVENSAFESYLNMHELLKQLGIVESLEKACAPNTQMIVLGILFDTVKMTLSLTQEKMDEIVVELKNWPNRKTCSLRQMQSLIGKLNFASSVVRSGRIYMSRLINTLRNRSVTDSSRVILTEENLNDVRWWIEHIKLYNGVPMEAKMPGQKWQHSGFVWSSDSSKSGLGGWSGQTGQFFHLQLSDELKKFDINSLECLALLICLKKWVAQCHGKKVLIKCDNSTTVTVINSGSAKNKFLQACLREMHHICATNSTEIKVIWVKTEDNKIADVLSRWDQHPKYRLRFKELTKNQVISETTISEDDLRFQYTSYVL